MVGLVAVAGAAACGGSGNGGRASRPLGDAAIQSAEVVARTGASSRPLDATPAPDGGTVYFSSIGDRGTAVVAVAGTGGALTTIAEGSPLATPSGLATSVDGGTLYLADPGTAHGGAVLAVPTAPSPTGGTARPAVVEGTAGWSPRGLDVVSQAGGDVVYFTGTDPVGGRPGLFRVPAAGGPVTTVAEGSPFVLPDSVVVTAAGVAYVTDQGAGPGRGLVLRVANGTASPVHTGLHLGSPAGVTLGGGDAILLVSSMNATTGADQVLFLDLATARTAAATKVIGANTDSSGGLHRARAAAVLAWADSHGQIYRLLPR
ncbi:MAG: hypothetical protein ABR511_09475 [Acidimicrobiales bacterium]